MVVHDAEIVNVLHLLLGVCWFIIFGGQLKMLQKECVIRIYKPLPFGNKVKDKEEVINYKVQLHGYQFVMFVILLGPCATQHVEQPLFMVIKASARKQSM